MIAIAIIYKIFDFVILPSDYQLLSSTPCGNENDTRAQFLKQHEVSIIP
jgi:hypothetical protein